MVITTPGESENYGNEGVLHIPQTPRVEPYNHILDTV